MRLIAESGLTKTDWRIISLDEVVGMFSTNGINPAVQSFEDIFTDQFEALNKFSKIEISEICFYGAGCSSDVKKNTVSKFISLVFPKANIYVESDIMAAARALFNAESGIACILGTGSNSGYYYEGKIVEQVPILGDEGSGAQIGRKILIDFLRKDLEPEIYSYLDYRFNSSEEEILGKIYRDKFPSRYLANLVSIMSSQFSKNEYFQKIIENEFCNFFDNSLLKYSTIYESNIGFVGSIAYHYRDILREIAIKKNVIISKIIQKPIDMLVTASQLEQQQFK